MSDMTREQFASSVAAAISSVDHLYREVDRLIAGLRDGLREPPLSLAPLRWNLGKSARNQVRFVVRTEFGLLFGPVASDDDLEEDDEGLEEETEDDSETSGSQKGGTPEIIGGQPLLAVRIAMYDPNRREALEPEVQFAVMSDWALGTGDPVTSEQRLQMQPYMFRRIARGLASVVGDGKGVRCQTAAAVKKVIGGKTPALGHKKGDGRRLSCCLPLGVERLPLFALGGSAELDHLIERMKEMWEGVNR